MCAFCNVFTCFDNCVGVLVIGVLVFAVFCTVYTVFLYFFFMYIYSYSFCLYQCKDYCNRVKKTIAITTIIIIDVSADNCVNMPSKI